jgi:pimeloyl-ACP methyl ester carboxylesterase
VHPERLYRYGRLVTPLLKSAVLDWVSELRAPALFVATDRDPVSHPEAARIVAERVPGAELALLSGDRHLGLMNRPAELAAVWQPFLAKHPA